MNKVKAKQTAKDWLFPALMFAVYDCSDSMEQAEKLENRFNAFVEDSISIEKFVKENLYNEYIKAMVATLREGGKLDEWKEELESTPFNLPIPFEEIQADLEKALNNPF